MKQILIVSYYFSPLNIMASKRYGYMCKYLTENGYEPIVLTTYARSGGYMDAKLDLPVPINEKNIIRIGMMGVKYPLQNYLMTLIFDWMKRKNKQFRVLDETSFGWFYKVKQELNYCNLKNVDVIIGTFPPVGNLLVAKYVSKMLKVPYIVEIRDLISDYEEGYNRTRIDKKIECVLERTILQKATGIISVTKGYMNILKKRYKNKKFITVYNGWEFKIQENTEEGLAEDYLYYAGSLYEHRVESFKLLIETLKTLDTDLKLIIRSVGPKLFTEQLKKFVKELAMENQVLIKDADSEDIVREEQAKAKINLLISSIHKDDMALMTTLPGKLFELMNVNKPILAITDESSEIGEVLKNTNKGIATSNKKDICDFINGGCKAYVGNDKINDYSRKKQAEKLCKFLDFVIKEETN